MYCPNCSKQQPSEAARFCSGCGFPIDEVTQLIADSEVRSVRGKQALSSDLSPRMKGVRQGLIMLIITLLLAPLLTLFVSPGTPGSPVFMAVIFGSAGSLLRIAYALIFQASMQRQMRLNEMSLTDAQAISAGKLTSPDEHAALPPAQSMPTPERAAQRTKVAHRVQPPSITERTTSLLD